MFRKQFQKGTPKIYDQLESKVPYPTGGRVELARGSKSPAWQRKEGKKAKKGLWYNIAMKRKRGEKMRKKGEKGAPTEAAIKKSQS